ncbi:hypothetical protein MSAN_01904000 [Mycena sanguinolenta]|uniref:Uncharacterized protein n=1 Tax=Mycena sanguinolenta TaxID=230812 RepID=A0A8H6XNZ1_9AGAR|nr:hypothetical protein MSAN_01904000 [Mycena sanguinolenta]
MPLRTYNYSAKASFQQGTYSSLHLILRPANPSPPMKISNPTSSPADVQVLITYTVELGDPLQFFFEIVDNTRWIDVSDKEVFSGSGSFFTRPGDLGLHFIEAYNTSAVVGQSQPFAVGPTYTVLSPLSSSTSTTTTTSPTTIPPTSLVTVESTVVKTTDTTQITSEQGTPTPGTSTLLSTRLHSIVTQNVISTATPPATTFYESTLSNIVHEDTVLVSSTPSSSPTAISISSSRKSNNLAALIGGITVGATVVALIILLLVWRRRRRKVEPEKPESAALNSPPTIDPFFSFVTRPSGKYRLGFAGPDASPTSSPTSTKSSTSIGSEPRVTGREEDRGSSVAPSGQQLEWVLRSTNDPPPGYDLCL